MICPVCGHSIKDGEFVVKRFQMVGVGNDNLSVSRDAPTYQHADCHDPKGEYHK